MAEATLLVKQYTQGGNVCPFTKCLLCTRAPKIAPDLDIQQVIQRILRALIFQSLGEVLGENGGKENTYSVLSVYIPVEMARHCLPVLWVVKPRNRA